jgi:hypothetical protein
VKRLSPRKIALAFAMAILMGISFLPVNSFASGHAKAFADKVMVEPGNLPVVPVSEDSLPGGNVADTWTVDGYPVTASGPTGLTVTIQLTNKMGQNQLSVSASVPMPAKSSSAARRNASNLTTPYIWATPCVSGNVNNGWWKACDVIYMVQQNGYDYYLSDKEGISGVIDWPFDWYGMSVDNNWHSGNTIIDWTPKSGHDIGSCEDYGIGLSDIVSISESWEVCPQWFGFITKNKLTTDFGSAWTDSGGTTGEDGVDAIDTVHSPPNVPSSFVFTGTVAWNLNLL